MAGEGERVRPAPANVWFDQVACRLHADQSFFGKPIDPEVVARVRDSLDQYQGPRSVDEQEKIIARKVAEARSHSSAVSAEYWKWTHRVKEEGVPSFKLPKDPRKGMPTQEEYIKARVEEGLDEMRKNTKQHKSWVESLAKRMAAEKLLQLEAKKEADGAFSGAADERAENIRKRHAGIQKKKREEEKQYWQWHQEMKERVDSRPCSAPSAMQSGVESVSSMTMKKMQETMRMNQAIGSEYSSWVRSVSVPKFQLPTAHVDHEERSRRVEAWKERRKQASKDQGDYYEEVEQMKQKHHARIMGVVKERLEADKKFDEAHEAVAHGLELKMAEQKQKQAVVAAKSRRELKEMFKRVSEKPLFLEVAYKK